MLGTMADRMRTHLEEKEATRLRQVEEDALRAQALAEAKNRPKATPDSSAFDGSQMMADFYAEFGELPGMESFQTRSAEQERLKREQEELAAVPLTALAAEALAEAKERLRRFRFKH